MGSTTPSRAARLRPRVRLTYANVIATLALFLALAGGSAYAATRLITGKQIAKGTITSKNIKTRSLLATDFAKNQLPKGAKGATGATGATGAPGAAGVPGAAGAPGAAGTAVAYASVLVNGSNNPVIQTGAAGFSANPNKPAGTTGLYCLPAPSAADAALPATLTAFGGAAIVYNEVGSSSCPDPSVDIAVQAYSPNTLDTVDIPGGGSGFNITLP